MTFDAWTEARDKEEVAGATSAVLLCLRVENGREFIQELQKMWNYCYAKTSRRHSIKTHFALSCLIAITFHEEFTHSRRRCIRLDFPSFLGIMLVLMIVLSLKCIFIHFSSDSLTLFPFREGKVQLLREHHKRNAFYRGPNFLQ